MIAKPNQDAIEILQQTQSQNGCISMLINASLEEIDAQFGPLLAAVSRYKLTDESYSQIDKIVIGCLFDAIWELDQIVHESQTRNEDAARKIESYQESLREMTRALLWTSPVMEEFNILLDQYCEI